MPVTMPRKAVTGQDNEDRHPRFGPPRLGGALPPSPEAGSNSASMSGQSGVEPSAQRAIMSTSTRSIVRRRSGGQTSELQSLMRNTYAVFGWKRQHDYAHVRIL